LNKPRKINKNEAERKTIFFVWNYHQWGGAQIYFLALMRQVSRKFNVKAVLPAGSDKKILQYLDANHVHYEFYEGQMDLEKAETFGRRVKRRLNDVLNNFSLAKHLSNHDLKKSIIQIDIAPWAGLGLLFYLVRRTKVFITFHTAIPELSNFRKILWKTKFAALNASKNFQIAASNLDVKKSLRPFVNEARYKQIEVIYSSVNGEEIENALKQNKTREKIAEKYNFPNEKIWICNVGQFIERKGCWVFLEAIQILQKKRDDLFFFWLGTSRLSQEVVEKIEGYGLRENFRFLSDEISGQRDDLFSLWKMADLFVLPSFQEGLPVALIEAMALGQACIASEINAIPEAVRHLETGYLIETGDSDKLAKAIGTLADDKTLRQKLGENAQKFILKNFEEKIIGEKMLRLYEKVS
jgi:glycosyltransferase involved in cell wall biosynthesis